MSTDYAQQDRMQRIETEYEEAEWLKGQIEDLYDEIEEKKATLRKCIELAEAKLDEIEDELQAIIFETDEDEEEFEPRDTDAYQEAEKLVEEMQGFEDEVLRYTA